MCTTDLIVQPLMALERENEEEELLLFEVISITWDLIAAKNSSIN